MRVRSILLVSLMLLMSVSPLVSADFERDPVKDLNSIDLSPELIDVENSDEENTLERSFELVKLDESPVRVGTSGTSGRAPCPAIQNDGGSAGDAGNETATAKSLGSDPTTSIQGCVDTADSADWYSVQISQGYNICLLYTSPSPRDATLSRMPSSA